MRPICRTLPHLARPAIAAAAFGDRPSGGIPAEVEGAAAIGVAASATGRQASCRARGTVHGAVLQGGPRGPCAARFGPLVPVEACGDTFRSERWLDPGRG